MALSLNVIKLLLIVSFYKQTGHLYAVRAHWKYSKWKLEQNSGLLLVCEAVGHVPTTCCVVLFSAPSQSLARTLSVTTLHRAGTLISGLIHLLAFFFEATSKLLKSGF